MREVAASQHRYSGPRSESREAIALSPDGRPQNRSAKEDIALNRGLGKAMSGKAKPKRISDDLLPAPSQVTERANATETVVPASAIPETSSVNHPKSLKVRSPSRSRRREAPIVIHLTVMISQQRKKPRGILSSVGSVIPARVSQASGDHCCEKKEANRSHRTRRSQTRRT